MKKLLLFAISLISLQISSQENSFLGSFISNSQYYINDKKTGDFKADNRFRSNNYLKLEAYLTKFSFGLQVEGYAPQSLLNYSPNLDKDIAFATFFTNYNSERLDITIGHFYEQFGNGLILRSYENKQLGINNALRGGKISYTPFSSLQIVGLYGKPRVGFKVSEGDVFGLDTEFNLTDALNIENSNVNLGISIVSRSQKIDNSKIGFDKNTLAYSTRINYSKSNFNFSIDYATKENDALVEFGFVNTEKLSKGQALLLDIGYYQKGFGMNTTFRRLENMSFYSDRTVEGNLYNEQLINYLPSLTKPHDFGLTNIYVYQTQSRLTYSPFLKAGEIGFQFDLFYNLKKGTIFGGKYGTKLALNYSNWNGLDAEFDFENRTYDAKFLNFGEKYFTDLNIEVSKKWSQKWSSFFTYLNLFYNKKYLEETSGKVNAVVIVAETTYKLLPTKSIRADLQHLWSNDDKKNWFAGTLEFNVSSKLSLFMTDLYNYGNELKKIHYYNFGMNYLINNTHFILNYGRQRGGLICVGGVCRIVPESTGFGLSLNTSF